MAFGHGSIGCDAPEGFGCALALFLTRTSWKDELRTNALLIVGPGLYRDGTVAAQCKDGFPTDC